MIHDKIALIPGVLLALSAAVSLTPPLLHAQAPALRGVVGFTPQVLLVSETDDPRLESRLKSVMELELRRSGALAAPAEPGALTLYLTVRAMEVSNRAGTAVGFTYQIDAEVGEVAFPLRLLANSTVMADVDREASSPTWSDVSQQGRWLGSLLTVLLEDGRIEIGQYRATIWRTIPSLGVVAEWYDLSEVSVEYAQDSVRELLNAWHEANGH